ncbi:MAG: hypothetical protein JO287_15570 [Pseudonocardiales bacterium]|nr:hypothetical protein [Pseudonocardiales bacterium]
MSAHRALRALLAVTLGAAAISILLAGPLASAAPGDAPASDSAITVSGRGEFANLKVTVSQTRNLINQAITVSWTGGAPTLPARNQFGVNFLQIMQCWGDDPAGPDRTQCQYGGFQVLPNVGFFVPSRAVTTNVVDPKETLSLPAGSSGSAYVPFWAVGRPRPTVASDKNSNDFFDSQVTNEIPLGSTRVNGTGEEFFEVETVRQAAGLGCGDPVVAADGSTKGRSCWLVIVPRGTTEVDGSTRTGNGTDVLDSSPLSQTNWDNRLVVPLDFQPVGQACPIGAPERRIIGHELAADAVTSWQPALCAGGGALFSYSQLSDDVTRDKVLDGSTPGLAMVTNPIPPEAAPADHPLVYAPVALSGLTIAFNIEQQPSSNAPPADTDRAGQRFESMKLTPRLVAKLLSQSYRRAVQVVPDVMKHNPLGLTADPEFLDLNPEYRDLTNPNQSPPDALVQLDGSDITSLLWSWVQADPDASAFLRGTPDGNAMVVNPANQGLRLPTSTFPRNDQSCQDTVDFITGITLSTCTSDTHPFTKDMHDAGASASRGDSQARIPVLTGDVVLPTKVPRQPPGSRALLAVVDTATATRYGLPVAALRNAKGEYVTPTTASLLAAEQGMKPSAVPGVLGSEPAAGDPAAYPLTALSYAVTAPSALDAAAGKDYAAFLRYAAGPGQQPGLAPGLLPLGLVPLPEALKAQTAAAAATVEAQAGQTPPAPAAQPTGVKPASPAGGPPGSTSGPSVATRTAPNVRATGTTATRAGAGVSAAPAKVPATRPGGSVPKAPSQAPQPVAGVRRTPALPGPAWLGVTLLIILIGAALAGTSPPAMHLLRTSPPVEYLVRVAARRRARREVRPTEP